MEVQAVTAGISVRVETFYQTDHSRPQDQIFVFAYRITIENNSLYPVQLLRRHWYINDCNGATREVAGDGVVGQQPYIAPNESHQYISWTQLSTEIGKMHGTYTMFREADGALLEVEIPEFKMVAPYKLN
jgi:ApaG protein